MMEYCSVTAIPIGDKRQSPMGLPPNRIDGKTGGSPKLESPYSGIQAWGWFRAKAKSN
jgi:hypothetical protein